MAYCDQCQNTGEVNCYCGGDNCVCGGDNGDGTNECPKCHGEPNRDDAWGRVEVDGKAVTLAIWAKRGKLFMRAEPE